jgi:hypothetical protein
MGWAEDETNRFPQKLCLTWGFSDSAAQKHLGLLAALFVESQPPALRYCNSNGATIWDGIEWMANALYSLRDEVRINS